MGIEPLSSAMTYQAQGIVKAPVIERGIHEVNNETHTIGNGMPKKVDTKTVTISEVGTKEQNNSSNEEATSQYASEQIKKAIDQISQNMDNSIVQFGIHEDTNRVTIKIIDKDTKKVIRELPPERILDMIAKAMELAGLMVDERR